MSILDNLKTTEEVAALLELAPETLVIWRSRGKGPPYLKIGRMVWYPLDRLDSWLEAQVREPYEPQKPRRKVALPFSGQLPSPQWKHGPRGHKTREERRAELEAERRREAAVAGPGIRLPVTEEIVSMLQEEAKRRQEASRPQPGEKIGCKVVAPGSPPIAPNDSNEMKGDTCDLAGRAAGVSGSTVQRALQVKEADPEQFERVKRGETLLERKQRLMRKRMAIGADAATTGR